ncbi:MAG: hypothetical protein S4CHLAM20_03070 [Chlamydiia bacterium]|nr:hypothetical protein [Chlamydiia bacterium]
MDEGFSILMVYPRMEMLKKLTKSIFDWIGAGFLGGSEIFFFYVRRHVFKNYLPNYSPVKDQRLYRGGQPTLYGLEELKKKGIGVIVNLRARNSDTRKLARLTQGEMACIHVPIYPFHPTDTAVIKFLKIFIKEPNLPVYVHCFHGADRTGLVCAMYRIVFEGWDKARAITEMREKGFHFWHRSIISYIENSDVDYIKKQILVAKSP